MTKMPNHGGTGVSHYGEWDQGQIVDGSGIYLTRNVDYEGMFELRGNQAYDNGINGLVVHKTTHESVTVEVKYNKIFDNGKTDKDLEGRQHAGGIAINGGTETTNVYLLKNKVSTKEDGDVAYQCFGDCNIEDGSLDNIACNSSPSNKFTNVQDDTFSVDPSNCENIGQTNEETRNSNPPSGMPGSVQFTPFLFACNNSLNFIENGPGYNQKDLITGCASLAGC